MNVGASAESKLRATQLQLEIAKAQKEIEAIESEIQGIRNRRWRSSILSSIARSILPAAVAVGGVLTAAIAALTYAKSVDDTQNARFYQILEQLTRYQEVDEQNAPRATVLLSRLESEFLLKDSLLDTFISANPNRAFEIAYVSIPFAKHFGGNLDTVGIVASNILTEAVARMDSQTQLRRITADWGNHIDVVQGKNTSNAYLYALQDVTCQIGWQTSKLFNTKLVETCEGRVPYPN